jgi:hypothetical protein
MATTAAYSIQAPPGFLQGFLVDGIINPVTSALIRYQPDLG